MGSRRDGVSHVYWITGLSGAGKSTLCRRLVEHLRDCGRTVVMLDGDELREVFDSGDAFTGADRLRLAMRYARLCRVIAAGAVDVAISTVSLFRDVHEWNRSNLPGYVEIFLDVPMAELCRRDPKGLYRRAARGELRDVAGLDLAVDYPTSPHVRLQWRENLSADRMFGELLERLGALDAA